MTILNVKILNKRVNQNDYQIKSIGYLLDFATKDEVKQYYGNVIEEVNEDEESNFII